MHVTVHRPGGRQGLYKARIEQVAEAASRLVAERMGGRMPSVRIVLTDGAGIAALQQRAAHELIAATGEGQKRPSNCPSLGFLDSMAVSLQSHPLGHTALDGRGTLLLINGPKQKNIRDLDETLVHELVHCVQLNDPETHRRQISFIRQLYTVDERNSDFGPYQSLMDRQEIEAYDLEGPLAKKLPPSVEVEV